MKKYYDLLDVNKDFAKYYECQQYLKSLNGEKPDPEKIYHPKFEGMLDIREDMKVLEDGVTKERKPLFFCSGIRVTWNPGKKEFEIGINHYRKDGIGALQIKFHGGCSILGESIRRCLQRECLDETGKYMPAAAPVIYHHAYAYRKEEIAQDAEKAGKLEHLLVFFLDEVPYDKRNLFIKTKSDSDNGESSPVIWTPLDQELINEFFFSHKPAMQAVHQALLDKYGMTDRYKSHSLQNLHFSSPMIR